MEPNAGTVRRDGGAVGAPGWDRSARGTQYMIAAPTPEAVEAGLGVMEAGGNAIDGAVAAATALWVTDPAMASVGGRAQILVRLADGRVVGIDGATQAPAGVGEPWGAGHGYPTAPVPGAPMALEELLTRYGTRSWEEILAPAIRMAEEGFVLKADVPAALERFRESLEPYPGTRRHFFKADGTPYAEGELFRQPALARTLKTLAREGADALYDGPLADAIVADMEANGGLVRHADLAGYSPMEGPVVRGSYRGYEIAARGGNCDGASVIQMLQTLEHFDLAGMDRAGPEYVNLLAQTLLAATVVRHGPDSVQVAPDYAARLAREIEEGRRGPGPEREASRMLGQPGAHQWAGDGETNHLSVVDSAGNAVAITQSIGNSFGSKVANPDLGFFYAYSYDMNDEPVPGQREWTSQAPTMILESGRPFLVLGSAGSNRIPGSIVRTVVNVIDHGMGLEEALGARRWYIRQSDRDELRMEATGLPVATLEALREMGYGLRGYEGVDGYFGRVHVVMAEPETGSLVGAGDPRDFGGAGGC